LKSADVGDGLILRLYEPHGARGEAVLRFDRAVQRVERVNLMEEPETGKDAPALEGDNVVRLKLGPFEIATLRLVL
jgi:alpha-mannosidase